MSNETERRELAALVAAYYRKKIGELMHQAEHWAQPEHYAPLAVNDRLDSCDTYYQVVALFERSTTWGRDPFATMREELERGPIFPKGAYPPSAELHRYRDARFAVDEFRKSKS